MKPTEEQQKAIDLAKTHQHVRVNAYAGAGKSSTLRMIAEEIAAPALYICFNKSTAEEAREKFPSYVDCKTSHSMAYAAIGKDYVNKLKRPQGKYVNVCGTGTEIASYFKIEQKQLSDEHLITVGAIGAAIKETLTRFEQSADEKLEQRHVSFKPVERFNEKHGFDKSWWRTFILKHAEKLWQLRVNKNSSVLITHDTYLKLWQLSKPNLAKYELIFLDEAQDSNPCLLDILYRQNTKLILVGDKYQSIYIWRGAINAMEQDGGKEWNECLLSTSFRYGENVAYVANKILQLPEGQEVKGYGSDSIKPIMEGHHKHTRIFRTNAALILDAVEFITAGVPCSLEIDTKDFVKLLESAVALKQGNTKGVKHDEITPYNTWKELEEDNSLPLITSVVNKNMHYTILGVLNGYVNSTKPEVIFTTAHKSKGREWDVVMIADDFKSCYNDKGEWIGLSAEERNLLYVAATRAKKTLIYNGTIEEYLEYDI